MGGWALSLWTMDREQKTHKKKSLASLVKSSRVMYPLGARRGCTRGPGMSCSSNSGPMFQECGRAAGIAAPSSPGSRKRQLMLLAKKLI